jgi:hypothetical protein
MNLFPGIRRRLSTCGPAIEDVDQNSDLMVITAGEFISIPDSTSLVLSNHPNSREGQWGSPQLNACLPIGQSRTRQVRILWGGLLSGCEVIIGDRLVYVGVESAAPWQYRE